ncbi:MAG: hypothetical protein AAFR42_08825 [Cyanobacteria bacterium J06628_6]
MGIGATAANAVIPGSGAAVAAGYGAIRSATSSPPKPPPEPLKPTTVAAVNTALSGLVGDSLRLLGHAPQATVVEDNAQRYAATAAAAGNRVAPPAPPQQQRTPAPMPVSAPAQTTDVGGWIQFGGDSNASRMDLTTVAIAAVGAALIFVMFKR